MQKFSKSGSAVFLVAGVVLTVVVHRHLPPGTGEAHTWFSVASGALLASGLSSLWLLLSGRVETRGGLVERSQGVQPIVDGEAVVATGRVRAAPPFLTAPLSGLSCVAYFYRIYYLRKYTKGHNEEVPVYWGYASKLLVVDTPSRSFTIAAPQLSIPRTAHRGDEAVARAREYIRTVAADLRRPRPFFAGDPVMQWMRDITPDEDGSARRDWKSAEQFDPATLQLEELVLTSGTEVSVHGRWSEQRRAIWTDEAASDVPPTLTLGPPTTLGLAARGAPPLAAYWVGTLLSLGLGVGLIWFAAEVWPHLK
jgi:hypothetical protein